MGHWTKTMVGSALLLGTMFLSACGGGGGGGHSGGTPSVSVAGVVTDPAIRGAQVALHDREGGALASVVVTDDAGAFQFLLQQAPPEGAWVTARGGEDVVTGYSFRGLTLEAPLAVDPLFVTPLTTLVRQRIQSGEAHEAAVQTVADWTGLPPERVPGDPRQDEEAQQVSLQLTVLLHALRDEPAPVSLLLAALEAEAALSPDALIQRLDAQREFASTGLGLERAGRLLGLFEERPEATALSRFRMANLEAGLVQLLEVPLDQWQGLDAVSRENVETLLGALQAALGERGLPADSARMINLMRYLNSVQPQTLEALQAEDWKAPQLETARVVQIATSANVVDASLPLSAAELLGQDNDRRAAYYFSSDLSPFNRASMALDGVLDDEMLSSIYALVAEAQARFGLEDEALRTLNTSVFSSTRKAEAMAKLGLYSHQRGHEGAQRLYAAALAEFDAYVQALGGAAWLAADDGSLLALLYRYVSQSGGSAEQREQVLGYVQDYVDAWQGDSAATTAYSRLVAAFGNAAGKGIVPELVAAYEAGEASQGEVEAVLELYQRLVEGIPPLANGRQTIRALYTVVLADLKDRAGDPSGAMALLEELWTLPESEWQVYYKDAADVYGRAGRIGDYMARAEALPAARHKAALEAALGWLIEADLLAGASSRDVIDQYRDQFKSLTDLNVALTWNTFNQKGEGVFLRLLSRGQTTLAAEILDVVTTLVDSTEWQELHAQDGTWRHAGGCGRLVQALELLGRRSDAQMRLNQCLADQAAYQWETQGMAFLDARMMLQHIYSDLGSTLDFGGREQGLFQALLNNQSSLSDAGTTLSILSAFAGNDTYRLGLDAYRTLLPEPVSGDLDVATAHISFLERLAKDLVQFRARIAAEGAPDAARQALLQELRQLGGTWGEGTPTLLETILASSDGVGRAGRLQQYAQVRAALGDLDGALMLARQQRFAADRDKTLDVALRSFLAVDAFPGLPEAFVDTDDDGRPDFFIPGMEQGSRLELDEDSDGDGCADDVDRRPFVATDHLGDCAA